MQPLTLALVPIAAGAALLTIAALLGRWPRRYTVNLLLAVLLLCYFGATAGLGIFWVAAQDLPVFDLHYLFGYLTMALVVVHVGLNWRAISNFLRRRAPALATRGRARWRPAVRVAARLGGWAILAAVAYWFGRGAGATTIRIVGQDATRVQPAGEGDSTGGSLAPARLIPRQLIEPSDGPRQPVTDYFHARTSYTHALLEQSGPPLNWATQPSPFEQFADAPRLPLPRERVAIEMPTGAAVEAVRRPLAGLGSTSISLEQLSTLLQLTNGVTETVTRPGRADLLLRAAPSAGALYPTVIYLLANGVTGLAPGLYHYDVREHALHGLRSGAEVVDELADASARGAWVRAAPLTLVFAADFYRSAWKYEERSWRYSLLDTGHVGWNAMVAAAGLGWASQPIARFDDDAVRRLLPAEAGRQEPLLLLPIGAPNDECEDAEEEWSFVARPRVADGGDVPDLIDLCHGMTRLARAGEVRVGRLPTAAHLAPRSHGPVTPLPPPELLGGPLGPTIEKRRSRRVFGGPEITIEQLSSLLYHSFALGDGDGDPGVADTRALRLYVVIHRAGGLAPGAYEYLRQPHALSLIAAGDLRERAYAANLYQEFAREAGLLLVKTIDRHASTYPDGDRGYRYAALEAGMLGGRIYLQAEALGLGACGIGAFFDADVAELVGSDLDREHVIYVTAVGVPAE